MTEEQENLESTETEGQEVNGEGGVTTTELEEPTAEEKAAKAQKAIEDRIAKKHNEYLQEKQRALDLEAKYKEAQEQLNQYKTKEEQVVVPKLPDPDLNYEDPDEYKRQMSLYSEALVKQGEYNKSIKDKELAEQRQKEQQEREFISNYQSKGDNYINKAKSMGMDEQDIRTLGQSLYMQGLKQFSDLEDYIMSHDKGPLIVEKLAKDHELAEKVLKMQSTDAAVYIATQISPSLEANNNTLPPPERNIEGSAPTGEDPEMRGWKTYS